MKILLRVLILISAFAFLQSCSKENDLTSPALLGIDPVANKDGLNKVLQMEGHYYDGEIPRKKLLLDSIPDTSGNAFPELSLSGTQRIIELAQGVQIYLPFKFTQNGLPFNLPAGFRICNAYIQVSGSNGYWKTPVKVEDNGTEYYLETLIPKFVKEGAFNFSYSAEICGKYLGKEINYITDTTTTNIDVLPKLNCADTLRVPPIVDTLHGSVGLTIRKVQLGEKKGRVRIRCFTYTVGDRIDIMFNNNYVISTAGALLPEGKYPRCKSPNGPAEGFLTTGILPNFKDYFFDYDPTKGRELTIYGLGSCNDGRTVWDVIVYCPE